MSCESLVESLALRKRPWSYVKNDHPCVFEETAAAELGDDRLLAPLTFISLFGCQAQGAFFKHANIPTEEARSSRSIRS